MRGWRVPREQRCRESTTSVKVAGWRSQIQGSGPPDDIAFHCKRCGRTGTAAHRSDGEGAGRASNVSAVSEAFRRVGALRIGRARSAVDYPGGRPIVTQGLPIAL